MRLSDISVRPFAAAIVAICTTAPLYAHNGADAVERAFRKRLPIPAGLACATPDADALLKQVILLAGEIQGETHKPILPPGTVAELITWTDGIAALDAALPEGTVEFRITPLDTEGLSRALTRPFTADPTFRGATLRLRKPKGTEYLPLAEFIPQTASPPAGDDAKHAMEFVEPLERDVVPIVERGGPVSAATRQPIGALTGVTVFVSAGHGWTAGDTNWFLQRPVLLSMCEDYGNIDVLNYFCQFAFNAGATVVPLRPAGWQPVEIVLDNDDAGVTYQGAWSNGSSSKYFENGVTNSGVVYRFASAATVESSVARFTPTIATSDFYPVYTFVIASANRTVQTYRIRHAGGTSEIAVDHRNVGNGWVWLGTYYLTQTGENWVEISNQSTVAGVVIADAIRWGGGLGDIVRSGPGTISGYSRDEECQRYWAQSQLGDNAVGFDSGIWDPSGSDESDNVGTGARVAREMNREPPDVQTDRWKRVHLEFHSNAFDGNARGQLCLISNLGQTTNQTQFATILSNEIDADLNLLSPGFEHPWVDRAAATLTGAYGAIATTNNDNEFDATLVELAFHDNGDDARLLRSPMVRRAMARSCVQGIVRFLNTLPGSQVPLAFAPDTPREPRVEDLGGGTIRVTWAAPLSDGAIGGPASGYVVYQSADGIGFGDPIILGNVTSTTIPGVPTGQTRYFRIAATNAGGESMPTEVLAVRRPASGTATNLIVNAYDTFRRQINTTQTFTHPPAYNGQTIERQHFRESNAFDYVIEHANALAALGEGFACSSHEAVGSGALALAGYSIVIWAAGNEMAEDDTISSTELTALTTFLNGGGDLFISGANLAYDLINQSGGVTFAQNSLRMNFVLDASNSYDVTPTAAGVFAGMQPFDFDPGMGARYNVASADVIAARTGGRAALTYVGGTGGSAAVQYSSGVFNTVTLAFPFETIADEDVRTDVMARVLNYLRTATGPNQFDNDGDGDIDFTDFQSFLFCFRGQGVTYPTGNFCRRFDTDADADVDLRDFQRMQEQFTGPLVP